MTGPTEPDAAADEPAEPGADGASWQPPPWEPPAVPFVEEALEANAFVSPEFGRWIVYLDVVLVSGSVRRKVGDFPTQARADQAARIIERNARRLIRRA